jgi:hypothetical protein
MATWQLANRRYIDPAFRPFAFDHLGRLESPWQLLFHRPLGMSD